MSVNVSRRRRVLKSMRHRKAAPGRATMRHRAAVSVALAAALPLLAAPAASAGAFPGARTTIRQWRIVQISRPSTTYGRWKQCSLVQGGKHGGTVGCSRGFTASNTVSGSVGVSYGVLSATLGYSVTASVTLTGNGSHPVPPHKIGVEQWRPEFRTRSILQRRYQRTRICGRGNCRYTRWVATGHFADAIANQYISPAFRGIIRNPPVAPPHGP